MLRGGGRPRLHVCSQPLMHQHCNPPRGPLRPLAVEHRNQVARHARHATIRQMGLHNHYDIRITTVFQDGRQLVIETAAAVPKDHPDDSLAPAPLGAGLGRGGDQGPALALLRELASWPWGATCYVEVGDAAQVPCIEWQKGAALSWDRDASRGYCIRCSHAGSAAHVCTSRALPPQLMAAAGSNCSIGRTAPFSYSS